VAQTITQSLQSNFALVNEENSKSSSAAQQTIESSASDLIWIQIGSMMFIGFLILMALCTFLILRVIIPINRLKVTMQDIAAGDGNLTQRLPVKGNDEISNVATAFNLFVGKIQQTLMQTSQSTNELNEAAGLLADLALHNSENVDTQRAETQQVATAVIEMTATVKDSEKEPGTGLPREYTSDAGGPVQTVRYSSLNRSSSLPHHWHNRKSTMLLSQSHYRMSHSNQ
jgi:methyl-accepting chemotaxis protein